MGARRYDVTRAIDAPALGALLADQASLRSLGTFSG